MRDGVDIDVTGEPLTRSLSCRVLGSDLHRDSFLGGGPGWPVYAARRDIVPRHSPDLWPIWGRATLRAPALGPAGQKPTATTRDDVLERPATCPISRIRRCRALYLEGRLESLVRADAGTIMREVRIEDLREPRRDAGEEQAFYEFAVGMKVDLDVERHRRRRTGRDGPARVRGRVPSRSAGSPGRRPRGRHGPVRTRPVHRARAARRTAEGPAAIRGLRAAPPRGARGRARATGHRGRAAAIGHHAPGEPAGGRLPVPFHAVVGGDRADPGHRGRTRP